jgi:ABC-2 type transport system ATP-binding protein
MLSVKDVVKKYSHQVAVNKVSFEVAQGSIFGLLGPNGAGKSSLLRMITGITQPDSGSILFNDAPFQYDIHNEQIGYMPEEKGLYKKMKVAEQAEYLGRLKGMTKADAKKAIDVWFQKLEIDTWRNKKVEDLSKGMSQKLQFITTVMHQPKLLILDEPFSGLDPVNAELIKQEIYALAKNGATIIFSTHRMEQVEEICNTIILMNKGEKILDGTVKEVKENYKTNSYILQLESGELSSTDAFTFLPLAEKQNTYEVQLMGNRLANEVLSHCIEKGLQIKSFAEVLPSLNDIFIRLVEGKATTQFNAKA